jgi:hypothetical protein
VKQHFDERRLTRTPHALALAAGQAIDEVAAARAPWRILTSHAPFRRCGDKAGTMRKPIETISVGDLVWAWDEDSGQHLPRPVVRLFSHHAENLVAVRIRTDRGFSESVKATANHPFCVAGKSWVAARSLAPGDELITTDDGSRLWVESASVTELAANVFNFEVFQAHNYHVGVTGALVHNRSDLEADQGSGLHDDVPDIRVAFELEQYDGLLQHIIHKLDVDHLQSTLPRDLRSYYVNDTRPNSYILEFAATMGISMGSMTTTDLVQATPFSQLPRITQAHLVIQAMSKEPFKLQAGPIRLKAGASADDIEAFRGMDGMKDGGALEVFNAEEAPVYGTDGLLPSIDKYVRIYPRESGMSVEVLGHLMHAHFSERYGKKMTWGRSLNVLLPLNILQKPGGDEVLEVHLSGLSPVHEKGLVRVVNAYQGKADRVEVRTLPYYDNRLSIRDNIGEIARSFLEEHRLYKHLRLTMAGRHAEVQKIFDSRRRTVLMDDLHYLLRTREMEMRIPHAMDAWPASMSAIRQEIRRLAVPRLYGYSVPTTDDAVNPTRSRRDFMNNENDPLRP